MANTVLPATLSIAPFPEGFKADADEFMQQAYQNTTVTVEGNLLTGLYLPPGTTLPTADQGPIAMGGVWYFWDPVSGQYQPQTVSQKTAKNYARNSAYQVAQQGTNFTIPSGTVTQTYDMAQTQAAIASITTGATVLTVGPAVGPSAGIDNDLVPGGINYLVGSTLVPTLAATDLFAHEHLIEGIDLVMLQGEILSLSFSCLPTVAGTYSVYLANGSRNASFVVNFTILSGQANTWVRVKINGIPPFPAIGTWSYAEGVTGLYIGVVMATGSQWQTASQKTWLSGFFAGTSSNINMLTVAANAMAITGIKLEAASASTYLQVPSFAEEYDSMQRYYYTSFNYQSTSAGVALLGVCHLAALAVMTWPFPRRMCKAPSVVPFSSTSFTTGTVRNMSTAADVTVSSLVATQKGVSSGFAVTGAAKADVILALIRADARLS